jgi:hypothetical protein
MDIHFYSWRERERGTVTRKKIIKIIFIYYKFNIKVNPLKLVKPISLNRSL